MDFEVRNRVAKDWFLFHNWIGREWQEFGEHTITELINSTISDVASKEGITQDRVNSIIKRHVPIEIDWSKIKEIKDLGIDEIALKKGHKDFVVIIRAPFIFQFTV